MKLGPPYRRRRRFFRFRRAAAERSQLAGRAQQVLQKGAYTRDQLVGEVRRLVRGHGSVG